jgi:hypothetical protein
MEGKKCSVCKHQEINAINEKLISGVPVRSLAKEYNLGVMALQRHRANHLPKELVKARDLQEIDAADRLLDRVEGLYDKALNIQEKAESAEKYQPAVSALKEARASLELIARMIGELRTGTHINITYNQEFIEARQQIYNALLPYPKARQAVVEALDGEVVEGEYEEVD